MAGRAARRLTLPAKSGGLRQQQAVHSAGKPGGYAMIGRPSTRRFFRGCVCCPAPAAAMTGPTVNRRNFLAGGVAALGLGAGLGTSSVAGPAQAQAQVQSSARSRIDVHHHFIPKFHVDAMQKPGRRAGGAPPKWSPELSIEEMDKSGIATSIVSIVQPGIWYGDN